MTIFEGSGVAIVTPFTENGVNYDELKRLINWQIEEGTDAIVICGTTGEASTMTLDEKKEVIKFAVDVTNKRVPVIAGTGSNCTSSAIAMSKYAESIGVDALLVVTPYYNKTNSKGLFKHYEAINAAVNIPIILYNVPGRTGMNISPKALKELSKLNNVVAIKEASGDLSQVAQMRAICKDTIDIYSGNDDQITPVLALGGKGVISVLANIMPKETHNIVNFFKNGKVDEAIKIQTETITLINALFSETNPIPVKTALELMGYNVGSLRLPLYEMDKTLKENLKTELKSHGLV